MLNAALIRQHLQQRAEPEKAEPMQRYMKSAMPFWGVQRKPRVEIERLIRADVRSLDQEGWRRLVRELWSEASHREERYMALAVLRLQVGELTREDLPWLRRLVVEGAWWDLVDEIAGRVLSPWFKAQPEMLEHMDVWIQDPDLWVRRAALLCQLKFKEQTDLPRLFGYVLKTAHEEDFFIRKAIGWALRQYAHVDPEPIRRFVLEHEDRLSKLSVREALKNVGRG